MPSRDNTVPYHKYDNQGHRDNEVDQLRKRRSQGEDHPREVDFGEHLTVDGQAVARVYHGIRKIGPRNERDIREDSVRNSIRGDFG